MRSPLLQALIAVSVAATLVACERDDLGEDHPTDVINYPVSVTADPSGRLVWVTSGNFDLSYRGGAVLAVDITTHDFVTDEDGEAVAFMVGGYPGPFHVLERNGEAVAGYVLSREDDALYHVTLSGDPERPRLDCPEGARVDTGILKCLVGGAIAFDEVEDSEGNSELLELGADPYSGLVHKAGPGETDDLLLTGALGALSVASFTLDVVGRPELVDSFGAGQATFAFAEDPITRRIYTTSKLTNVLNVLAVSPPDPDDPDAPLLELTRTITLPASEVADHARSLAVSTDGKRLYAAYRSPSSLLVLDVSEGADGVPFEQVLAKVDVGLRPGDLAVVPASADLPELVYVSCFREDRIDVVDPKLGVVVDSIPTGRGPFGLAYVDNPTLGLRRLYVANFHHESVGVVELDPASPYFHVQFAEIR